MSGQGANTEAYQVLTDLLVTIRRIIHRGLVKASGKTWYLDGCPPGLFERLVERKEREMAIDRFNREYQELITFASLDDLAAIVEFNTDLARLLESLEPESAPMIERLREIEALRLKLAASVPFDDDDYETLTRYHREFRESLVRRKRSAPEAETPTTEPDGSASEAQSQEDLGEQPSPAPDEREETAAAGAPSTEFRTQAVSFEELVEVVGGVLGGDEDFPGGKAGEEGFDPLQTATGPSSFDPLKTAAEGSQETAVVLPTALDVERAMAADDDLEVLRVVHREVSAAADSVYRNRLDGEYPVWEAVRSSGWYDLKKADLALAPLELFYDLVGRAAAAQEAGADTAGVRKMLAEAGFSKLLLSLRDMFMRHKL